MSRTKRPIWFRTKSLGWGWYPATWQGWIITLVYVVLYALSAIVFGAVTPAAVLSGGSVIAGFMLYISLLILLSATLIAVCYRYGEKPSWRWLRTK